MRLLLRLLPVLLLGALLPLQAEAKKPHSKKHTAVATPAAVAADTDPARIVDDFHELLRQGRRAQVLSLLTPDAVIFETGYAGQSREDYAQNHVSDDAEFAGVTDYRVLHRQVQQKDNTAWVLTQASVQGIFGDQTVDLEQTETAILRRSAAGWQIAHIHWSAHTRPAPEPAPADAATTPPEPAPTLVLPTAPATPEIAPSSAGPAAAEVAAPAPKSEPEPAVPATAPPESAPVEPKPEPPAQGQEPAADKTP